MTIDRMHKEVKMRLNKINSNHKKNLPAAYIDDAINKATDDYIEIFYSGNNSKKYKFGFEVTQQRMDMLQTLIVPEEVVMPTINTGQSYGFGLDTLDHGYRHFVRGFATSPQCTNKLTINIVRQNDLDQKLLDLNTKPNIPWRRTLGIFANNVLYVYVDNFTLTSITMSYIRKPAQVFISGYDSLERLNGDVTAPGAADPKVNSDLPEAYHDLLVDMTVQYLAGQIEDVNKYQLMGDTILSKT